MNSPFEYQESLNSLHFTEEEKAAIARRAAEAARTSAMVSLEAPACLALASQRV